VLFRCDIWSGDVFSVEIFEAARLEDSPRAPPVTSRRRFPLPVMD
jgi:hypothetical protein